MLGMASLAQGASAAGVLLERAADLATLNELLDTVRDTGEGRVVLVSGEAGVGKTTLLRRFCDDNAERASVLGGACEPLFTPHPLGPLLDVAAACGGELESVVERGVA